MGDKQLFAKIDAVRSDLAQVVRPKQAERLRRELNGLLDTMSAEQTVRYAAHRRAASA